MGLPGKITAQGSAVRNVRGPGATVEQATSAGAVALARRVGQQVKRSRGILGVVPTSCRAGGSVGEISTTPACWGETFAPLQPSTPKDKGTLDAGFRLMPGDLRYAPS